MPKVQMQWHPVAHEECAGERLVFWRLGFFPTYLREEVMNALDFICERHEITGRTVYEVFGSYDLLLRLWLPKTTPTDAVDRDIKRTLAAFHLELCDSFEVEKIVRHWFWDDEEGHPLSEARAAELVQANRGSQRCNLDPPPSPQALRHVNGLVTRFNTGEVDRSAVSGDPLGRELLERNLIGIRNAEDGIKFTMVVSASTSTASRYTAMESLEDRLAQILDAADPVMERSLYSGMGFGRFLIFGKIPMHAFYELNRCLIEPITVEANLALVYRTRSETYIGSNPRIQRFSETLSLQGLDGADEEIDIEEILNSGESARVEFKGGVFTNVGRWLNTGERSDDGGMMKSCARAIVAMLNGAGGSVVTGILEGSSRHFADEPKLADEPRWGDLIITGLEFEWEDWKRKHPDEFMNRLRAKLKELIEPNPLDYVRMHALPVQGRTVCVICVEIDSSQGRWFYLRDGEDFKFVVRRDASSAVISGPEEDNYKRLHARTT